MKHFVNCLANGSIGALQAVIRIVERLPNTFRIKSDRISALRKRYEEFLEEDKRRKERNEFILGQLDEMRLCNGIVTLKCQTNYPEIIEKQTQSRRVTQNDGVSACSTKYRSKSHQPTMQITLKNPSDSTLLSEIMSKFILIPKRDIIHESAVQEYLLEQRLGDQQNDDTDWKSKYEILNQLKKNEKDSTQDEDKGANAGNFDIPEKDISYADVEYPLNDTWQAPIETKKSKDESQYPDAIPNSNVTEESNISSNTEEVKLKPTEEQINVDYEEPAHQGAEIKNIENEFSESRDRIENHDIPEIVPFPDYAILNPAVDKSEYPMDVINVADFTPSDDVVLHDGYNINPEGYGLNQSHFNNPVPVIQTSPTMVRSDGVEAQPQENSAQQRKEYNKEFETDAAYNKGDNEAEHTHEDETMNIPHKQEIEAFETEQYEMFYQEAPSENVEVLGKEQMYNTQNQNEDDHNQYYYEPPQDEAYAEELNKHDETIQLYDQNYAQQYVETPQVVFEDIQQQEDQVQNYESSQFLQEPQYVEQSQEYTEQDYGEQQLYTEQQMEYTQEQVEQQVAYDNQTAYGQQEQYEQQTLYEQQQAPYEQERAPYEQQQAPHEQQQAPHEQQEPHGQQQGSHEQQQEPHEQKQGSHEQQQGPHEQQTAPYEQETPYVLQQATYEQPARYEQQPANIEEPAIEQEPEIFACYTDPLELLQDREKKQEALDIQQITVQLDTEQGYNARQS